MKYAGAFGVACGQRMVIAANSDGAYAAARSLAAAGLEIVAIVDRREGSPAAEGARFRVLTQAT